MATRPPIGIPKLSRRAKILLGIAGVIILLLLVGSRLLDTYVSWLWYGEVGFRSVFSTMLLTRIALFFAVGILVGGLLAVSLYVAYRTRPVFVPVSGADDPLSRYRSTIVQRPKLFGIGIPVAAGVIAGATGQGEWQRVQLMLNGTSFGIPDPEFGKDIGFYTFTLPFITWLIGWLLVAIGIAGIAALLTHYVFGGVRVGARSEMFTGPARVQVFVTAGVWVVVWAVSYFFDRYELLFSSRNELFNGATYTDLNAVLPAKFILMFIAAFCAVAFFVGAFLRKLHLAAVAIVLLLLSQILVGWGWPTALEQISVKPNAAEKEAESIQRNLDATKHAFGLTDENVEYQDYQGQSQYKQVRDQVDNDAEEYADLSQAEKNQAIEQARQDTARQVRQDSGTVPHLRLLDPSILSATFTQQRSGENFYGFAEKLDIDRYTVDGELQEYIVAAREINTNGLAENQRTWINQRMVYTHGNGFVAAPASEIARVFQEGDEAGGSESGYPNYTVSDLQAIESGAAMDIPVEEPRIYYGELFTDPDYAIVNARGEFDLPNRPSDYSYEGEGGVGVGGLFKRLVFFAHYGEPNILLNGEIDEDSKIMYDRDPKTRVEKVAPWLTVDGDPYPAVVDGRIKWIVDGYTTLDNYPYAKQTPLGEATTDTLTGVARQENRDISYIRNSVKATVDAYDGTVKLHGIDDEDPVLKAWEQVFPGTVERGPVPEELEQHFRYPEDMFKVQRELLQRYHVDDPREFFQTQTFWSIPNDPREENEQAGTAEAQPPYYVMAEAPGQDDPTFQLQSAMTLLERQFLSAWVSASSDPEDYGKLTVLTLPQGVQTEGPVQVQKAFQTTDEVTRDRTLFDNPSVEVQWGNLLTLPVADGLLYVEPIYIQGSGENAYPQLARVLMYFDGDIGYGNTVQGAMSDLFGEDVGTDEPPPPDEGEPPPDEGNADPPPEQGGDSPDMEQAIADINAALQDLKQAQQDGDFEAQGQALSDLEDAMAAYEDAQNSDGGGGNGAGNGDGGG